MIIKRRVIILSVFFLLVSACTPARSEVTETLSLSVTHTPAATVSSTYTETPNPTETVTSTSTPVPNFSFVVTSDMSHYSAQEYIQYPNFFAALLAYVNQYGPGAFMISPGDVIPAADTRWTIDQVLGVDYLWFPIPGNHDFGRADISFLQNYNYDPETNSEPIIVNWGPESCPRTTYSFDYQNSHFIGLNVYCNEDAPWGIDGSISQTIYDWLEADLAETTKEHIFVFGHEPAFPQPDAQTGEIRHLHDSLDQYPQARDRFWQLLQAHQVVAYIHGHTHGYSVVNVDEVWQLGAGHAMGVRAAPTPGTFLIITVNGGQIVLQTYRGEEGPGFSFHLQDEVILRP